MAKEQSSQEKMAPGRLTENATTPVLAIQAPAALTELQALLAADGIFVAPTDTVFGLFCRYDSPAALARIYAAKDRPPQKAIPVLLGASTQLEEVVRGPVHDLARVLMAQFWPGPLTLVLPAQAHLPPILTAGAPTVAVRMPAHAGLLHLLRTFGPLAATSANRSGHAETHSVAEVVEQLAGRVDLILADRATSAADGEAQAAAPGLASTIVDLSVDLSADLNPASGAVWAPRILREGPLGQAVRELVAAYRPAPAERNAPGDEAPGRNGP